MLDQRFTRSAEVKEKKKKNLLFSITLSSTLWELFNLLGKGWEEHEEVAGFDLSDKCSIRFTKDFLMLRTGSEERHNSLVLHPSPAQGRQEKAEVKTRLRCPPPSQDIHGPLVLLARRSLR